MKKERHHRKPKSIGGGSEPPNTIYVPDYKHRAWHTLFGNMTARQIADEINTTWLDPSFTFKAVSTSKSLPY